MLSSLSIADEDCREVLDRVVRMIALKKYVEIENVVICEVWCAGGVRKRGKVEVRRSGQEEAN
jgi:hypothetical protein